MESLNTALASIDLCDAHHCDVTFLVEGKLVRFSRSQLEWHSPVFSAIFSERWSEGKDPSDPIESELTFDDAQILFKILTPNGGCNATFENVKRLLELGDFYQIGLVAYLCERFLLGNVSHDRFRRICELAAKFNLRELLKLVNQEYIIDQFCSFVDNSHEELLAVSAKARPLLDGAFAHVESKFIRVLSVSEGLKSRALHWLIVGYECGSQRLIDACMPLAARNSTPAKLLAAKAKLSVGLHCELMLQHHARNPGPKSEVTPRRKSVG